MDDLQEESAYREALRFMFSPPIDGALFLYRAELDAADETRRTFYAEWLAFVQSNEYQRISGQEVMVEGLESEEYRLERDALVVHVAGSKGKGSVCAMLHSCLDIAGLRTGLFSSPHLHTARERVRVGQRLISKAALVRLAALLHHEAAPRMPRFFNFFDRWLLLALAYFVEQRVQAVVLETGIGGRHDGTRHVPLVPRACIVSSISFDHIRVLCNIPDTQTTVSYDDQTLREIARNKAGIIRQRVPVFTSALQRPAALDVLREEATQLEAPLVIVEPDAPSSSQRSLQNDFTQGENSALVRQCVALLLAQPPLQGRVELSRALSGIEHTYWPCRYERLTLHNGLQVVIDGAHNQDSVDKLFAALTADYARRPLWSMFGCTGEHRKEMLASVYLHSHRVALVDGFHALAVKEQELQELIRSIDLEHQADAEAKLLAVTPAFGAGIVRVSAIVLEVIAQLEKQAASASAGDSLSPVLVVCGSLYLAAAARLVLHQSHQHTFALDDWVHQHDL